MTALEIRAGAPPSGPTLIWRFWALQRMEHLNGVWVEWERWFVDVEETHTSLPAVVFFRSPQADHHWVTAAGAVLDGAALAVSTVDIERDVQAEFCLRAGYLCLRRIADYYNFAHDPDPQPDDPISVTRSEWDDAVAYLEEAGVRSRPTGSRRGHLGFGVAPGPLVANLTDLSAGLARRTSATPRRRRGRCEDRPSRLDRGRRRSPLHGRFPTSASRPQTRGREPPGGGRTAGDRPRRAG